MAYKCDGEWHVEAADLDALRRTILRMYGHGFPADTPNVAEARVHDRLSPPDFTKKEKVAVDDQLIIRAEKKLVARDRDRYHAWIYNGITVALYQVR